MLFISRWIDATPVHYAAPPWRLVRSGARRHLQSPDEQIRIVACLHGQRHQAISRAAHSALPPGRLARTRPSGHHQSHHQRGRPSAATSSASTLVGATRWQAGCRTVDSPGRAWTSIRFRLGCADNAWVGVAMATRELLLVERPGAQANR